MWLGVLPAHATDQGRALVLDQGEDAVAVGGGAGELLRLALLGDLPGELARRAGSSGRSRCRRPAGRSRSRRSTPLAAGSCRPGRGGRRRGGRRGLVLRRVELPEQLRREGVAGLQRDHLLEHVDGRLGVALGQVVVGEHEPGRWPSRVGRRSSPPGRGAAPCRRRRRDRGRSASSSPSRARPRARRRGSRRPRRTAPGRTGRGRGTRAGSCRWAASPGRRRSAAGPRS